MSHHDFRSFIGWSLIHELSKDENESRIQLTSHAQPALFAVHVSLARLWQSRGIQLAAVVGHSVGEIAAVHIAGLISLEEAVRIIGHRGDCLQTLALPGRMIAVEMEAEEVRKLLQEFAPTVCIVAVNSPRTITLSGESEAVELLEQRPRGRCGSNPCRSDTRSTAISSTMPRGRSWNGSARFPVELKQTHAASGAAWANGSGIDENDRRQALVDFSDFKIVALQRLSRHHRFAKIPYYHLPAATPFTLATSVEPCPVFPSVLSALFDLLPCLADPKVGPQWQAAGNSESEISDTLLEHVQTPEPVGGDTASAAKACAPARSSGDLGH